MQPFIEGLMLQAGLIVALGAQNTFVLECGLLQRHHWAVALLCSLFDALLIFASVAAATELLAAFPGLQLAIGIAGLIFLAYFALANLRKGLKRGITTPHSTVGDGGRRRVLLMALAFSALNPHVYVDTLILIGGYSAAMPGLREKLQFAAGASATSLLWFVLLVGLAAKLSPYLQTERSRRIMALSTAVVLGTLCVKLASDIF